MEKRSIAFIGAGGVAAYHAYALRALPFYYSKFPPFTLTAVASATASRRDAFANRYGFDAAVTVEELAARDDVDTVYILSPNDAHYAHLELARSMRNVRRIYLEKPLCVSENESRAIEEARDTVTRVQAGFQFLQTSAIRCAHSLWRRGEFGTPVHFQTRYLHGGYLDEEYRARRATRLQQAPAGGAMVDLGSHALSLAVAFLGDQLEVVDASHSGAFPEIDSDLCTIVLCRDRATGATGTVTASRISAGAGEVLEIEIRCKEGGFRVCANTETVEVFSLTGETRVINAAGDFRPHSEFPRREAMGGWLRSFVHANYLFINDLEEHPFPDLGHALAVQRLLFDTSRRLHAR